jgi:hypothetical protein
MLNPFPDLLMFGFFAPTIVRVVAALILLYGARAHWAARERGGHSLLFAVAHGVIGLMLLFGYYTQLAALAGLVGVVGSFIWPLRTHVPPLPRSTSILLIAIFVSLLLSGAGAFAFDLPL